MTERALATVERVMDVQPIPDADAIDVATVRGWKVVVKKGEFRPGDTCLYIEIDSLLPVRFPAFAFLEPRGVKTVEAEDGSSVTGHVLKTVKLRGQISQGLVLPWRGVEDTGADVTAILGIVKYEPPIPASLSGQIMGNFPTQFAPKTDAERVQNLTGSFASLVEASGWVATEKIDGTSVTFVKDPGTGKLRVASRNWELFPSEDLSSMKLARQLGLERILDRGMAVQGEMYGEGIQGNPLGIKGHRLALFAVYQDRVQLPVFAWPIELRELGVPVLPLTLPKTVEEVVAQVYGMKSTISPQRQAEGLVWHAFDSSEFDVLDGRSCFKVINNAYLIKHGG